MNFIGHTTLYTDVRTKMEKLNLSGKETKEEVIEFDEYLHTNGEWRKALLTSSDGGIIKELNYGSSEYTYYLCEFYGEHHIIYRCKKVSTFE